MAPHPEVRLRLDRLQPSVNHVDHLWQVPRNSQLQSLYLLLTEIKAGVSDQTLLQDSKHLFARCRVEGVGPTEDEPEAILLDLSLIHI